MSDTGKNVEATATQSPVYAYVEGRIHHTPPEVWDVLSRLLKVIVSGGNQWVQIEQNDVKVTFFGPQITPEPEPVPVPQSLRA